MPGKRRSEPGDTADPVNGRPSLPAMPASLLSPSPTQPQPHAATKNPSKTKVAPQPPLSQQVLVICRNKHWRYISSFHGPWLQLPPEILETIANANYNTPRPRPIDPAVFFDLVKIRRLVDDATNLAVRAASGVASIGQRGLPAASHHAAALGLGFGRQPPQTKLSPERKHRMREQATQKLTDAYRLDEIACSVATMQSASSLEEVASLVLQRNPQDPDAKYVHFFHEKIPSRQLAECTSLTPLNEIAAARPTDPEPLRTRAMVRVFKGDCQGAADDLTEALKLYRLYRPASVDPKAAQENQLAEWQQTAANRRHEDIILKERDQPSSLEMQLLFQRAGVYLAIACRHVAAALPAGPASADGNMNGSRQNVAAQEDVELELLPAESEAQRRMAEARKLVRHNAKRALRDYTAYLSRFEYSPDLPVGIAEDFTRRVNSAVHSARPPRSNGYLLGPRSSLGSEGEDTTPPHRIYALSDLFTSSPPPGLPPYPSSDVPPTARAAPPSPGPAQTTTETLTCHPLLTDALHALLLCHALVQTSAKELLRHAYMVARLARLADGYPVFQSSRCPARADWIEVLRAAGNWIRLAGSWEDLCAPAPLPLFQSTGNGAAPVPVPVSSLPATPARTLAPPETDDAPTSADPNEQRRDTGPPDPSVSLAIRTRQLRAERDYRLDNAAAALDARLIAEHAPLSSSPLAADTPSQTVAIAAANARTAGATAPGVPTHSARRAAAVPQQHQPSPASAPSPTAVASASASAPASVLDDGVNAARDYFHPAATDRAAAIARWVLEAPVAGGGDGSGGMRRRRKRVVRKAGTGVGVGGGGGGGGDGVVGEAGGDEERGGGKEGEVGGDEERGEGTAFVVG